MLTALAGVILAAAALWDVRARLIPNTLSLALAGAGLVHLALAGGLVPGLAIAAGFFAVGFVAFALGVAGGGDAKLLAAAGLWIPPAAVSAFFTVTALTGGVLALAVLGRRRWLAAVRGEAVAEPASVPYGAAIATGAGAVLGFPG
jgi:prepilin peptidase CpaA